MNMEGLSETRPLQLQAEAGVAPVVVSSIRTSSGTSSSSIGRSSCFQFNAAPSHFPPSRAPAAAPLSAAHLLATTESYDAELDGDLLLRSGDRNCRKTSTIQSHRHYSSSKSSCFDDDQENNNNNNVPVSADRCRSAHQIKFGYRFQLPPPPEITNAASSGVLVLSPSSSSSLRTRKRKALQPLSDAAVNMNPDPPHRIHSHILFMHKKKVDEEVVVGSTNCSGAGDSKSANWRRSMLPDTAAAAATSMTNSVAACQYMYNNNNGEPPDRKVKLPEIMAAEEEGVSSDPTVSRRHTLLLGDDDDDDDRMQQQQLPLSIFGRARARRGEATDLHSISERKRRIRITEKMRELHKLVPDGTKTNKASMLDEIIGYVKHLQSRLTDQCACAQNIDIESSRRGRGMYEAATCSSRGNPEPPSSSSLAAEVDRELMAMGIGNSSSCHDCRTEISTLERNSEVRRNYKYRDVIVRILDPEEEKLARAAEEVAALVTIGSGSDYSQQNYSRVDAVASYLAAAGITLLPIISSNSSSSSSFSSGVQLAPQMMMTSSSRPRHGQHHVHGNDDKDHDHVLCII